MAVSILNRRYIDAAGHRGESVFYSTGGLVDGWVAAHDALFTAEKALTGAAFVVVAELEAPLQGTPANTGPYSTVTDKVEMELLSSGGVEVSMTIAGPEAAIIEADDITLDKLDALVSAFVAQLVALASDKVGNAIVSLFRGLRDKYRR